MSGHSKWSTIKNKKAKNDGARAKIFTKIGRELIVAIKEGGSADHEGYGPGGIAVIVETLTDNRNRTAGEVRHYFDKFGGNLGTQGCVSFMFERKGVLITESDGLEEDKVMEDALENGASDFQVETDVFEIYTEPEDFSAVNEALTKLGYTFIEAEIEMVPGNYTKLDDEEQILKMQKLLDNLEDNDDVQNVWHNWEYDEPAEVEKTDENLALICFFRCLCCL